MTTNVSPPPNGEITKDSKGSVKNRWKGKLFSGEGWRKTSDHQESNADEVDSFLNGSGAKSTSTPEKFESDRFASPPSTKAHATSQRNDYVDRFLHQHPSPTKAEVRASPGTSLLAPRLDSTKHQGSPLPPQESDLGPIKDTYRRPKPRMNKGLRVDFTSAAPEIIGEGGDEAELPSREISKSLSRLAVDGAAQSPPLRRRSTGVGVPGKSDLPAVQSQYVHVQDVNSKELLLTSSKDHKQPNGSRAVLEDAPQHAAAFKSELLYTNPVSEPVTLHKEPTAEQNPRSESLEAPDAESVDHLGNSLTPIPSPLPLKLPDKSPPHYGFPNVAKKAPSPSTSPERADKRQDQLAEKGRSGSAPEIKPFSLRSVAKALGHDALDEFDLRVRGLFSLFRLGFSAHGDPMNLPFSTWIRIAAWWFLKGRMELESAVRSRPKSPDKPNGAPEQHMPRFLMQAYVDLSKAWWVVDDITPNHSEVKKYGNASMNSLVAIIENVGNHSLARLVEVNVAVISNMRALTMSMKRNNRLPPQPFEIQGLDSQVLVRTPALSPTAAALTMNPGLEPISKTSFFPLLIGDTPLHFSLGRMFSKMSLLSRHSIKAEAQMPCLISIVQNREDGDFGALVATQDGQVNLSIRSDKSRRSDLTWRLIHWNNATHTMGLPLSHELDLALELSEKDYKMLWDMCDHNQKVQQDFAAQADESLVFECGLHHFERLEMPNEPGGFPQGSIKDCRLRLFSKNILSSTGKGQRILHGGFRLVVLTGPSVKSPRVLRSDLSGEKLILFGPWRREDGPCLTVRMPGFPTLLLAFHKQEELNAFRLLASGDAIAKEDHASPPLPLRGFNVAIHSVEEDPSGHGARSVAELRWRQLQIVEKRRLNLNQPADSSDGLRMLVDCDYGSFIDRLNFNTGELKICLGVEDYNEVRLLRPAQPDITWSLEDRLHREVIQSLNRKLQGMARSSSIRTYNFCSLKDVHTFQAAVTGFSVRFDGHANSFSISRRRMVVPLQKKWAATSARLQILQQDTQVIQLAAFFKDFHHGTCMNFVLKGTDIFETSNKSGSFFLRVADAKFALPKGPEDPDKDFLCLDVPEYPSEHDDITIEFDNEEGQLLSSSRVF